MGWRYRKSINLGLGFRINLSKSGIGYSWGVPGYRITKMANGGRRTTYSIPGTGISYVEQNGKNSSSTDGLYLGNEEVFENVPISDFCKNDIILKKFNKVALLDRLSNFLLLLTFLFYFNLAFICSLFVAIIIKIIISLFLKINLYYEFDKQSRDMYDSLKEAIIQLSKNKKIWQVSSAVKVYNKKYNAGASRNVDRHQAFVMTKLPWYIKSNIDIFSIKLKNQVMYFTPDRIIIFNKFGKVFGCTYNDMYFGIKSTSFVETESKCNDSEIISYTWKYANLDGGRDLRFSNNRRYPVCKYGELTFKSPNGINTIIEFSNINLLQPIKSNLILFGNEFNKILTNNTQDNYDKPLDSKKDQNGDMNKNSNIEKKTSKIDYVLPNIYLLSSPKKTDNLEEVKNNIDSLNNILKTFKVNAKVAEVNCGPRFTKYQILLEEGTRLQKLTSISNEIAMGIAAKSVEMQLSSEKTNTVIITVPNKEVKNVMFRDVIPTALELTKTLNDISKEIGDITSKLESKNIHTNIKDENNDNLLLAIGKDMDNNNIIANLCNMPNILISGSTGSGISMCINAMISSLLVLYKPDYVKMLLIDTKKVQLNSFNGVPHLLQPVITEPKEAIIILKRIVEEIHKRCDLFKRIGVKNIFEYRNYLKTNQLSDQMPYIVIFIDDVADLVRTFSENIEYSITEITKLARTTGVYMVIATQRPTSDIITGTIKNNIPARISFSVPSALDSKIILDTTGAEDLDINGDMLFKTQNNKMPIRVQGSYISDKDITVLVDCWKKQANNDDQSFILNNTLNDNTDDYDDPLYDEVVDFLIDCGKASASLLQRRFCLGYNRAAKLIDILEKQGIVGSPNGAKPRDVLIKSKEDIK